MSHSKAVVRPWTAGKPQIVCDLARHASAKYAVNPRLLFTSTKERPYVNARSEVAFNLHQMGWSTPEIGKALGGRSHTRIVALLQKFHKDIPFEPDESGIWAI